jgi:hypothetical protein
MNAEQLWETTLNPDTRRLLPVQLGAGLRRRPAADDQADGQGRSRARRELMELHGELGRFHPHGDQSAYDALVRLAQDFNQRYPLIDGQGNFGSRDGDGAAAMRYTEARLAKITSLLLDEIDEGTVDFVPNYDGSTQEPRQLPARLPFALLNGASGIAVGLATEIPSHNLREVAAACVALAKEPATERRGAVGPDSRPGLPRRRPDHQQRPTLRDAYRSGRGSLKVRARWKIEELARGQWQLVVTELPPGVSSAKGAGRDRRAHQPQAQGRQKGADARSRRSSRPACWPCSTACATNRARTPGAPGVRAQNRQNCRSRS